MKAILVMEMPENCAECPCGTPGGDYCQTREQEIGTFEDGYINGQYTKPTWCPLKPMPKRKNYEKLSDNNPVKAWGNGWNACIDAIEGSGEDGKSS